MTFKSPFFEKLWDICEIKYKIDDMQYRAFVTQITPESLLTWAKGVAEDWQ